MVIYLSLEEKSLAFGIGDRCQVDAVTWLFDPDHKAENIGSMNV
jgi:hypothetical protein